jgi:phosphoribosylglycinamide formyltransferase 1
MSQLRVGVLVSGRGSNLAALIQAANDPSYPARIALVCANRDCPALEIATQAGIPSRRFPLSSYADREARDRAMAQLMQDHRVELVVCAGYDAILEGSFIRPFKGRIINIHPSLLPEFAGTMDAVAMALAAGVTETGCTVHLVTGDVDAGPIVAQRRVEVRRDDTVASLRRRIQAEEHLLLPDLVKRIAGQQIPLPV